MTKVYSFLSRLFDPTVVFSALTVVAAQKSIFDQHQLVLFLLVYFILILAPPVLIMYSLIRSKKVTNWDVSNRRQRIKVLSGLLGFLLIDCLLVWHFGNPFLVRMYALFFVWFLGFYVITIKWKISGHTGVMTLAVGLLYIWYGQVVLPAALLIPLIAGVRVNRRNHTVVQVVGGVVYSLVVLFFYSLFKI